MISALISCAHDSSDLILVSLLLLMEFCLLPSSAGKVMADLEVSAVIENGCDEYVETILCV